MTKRTNPPEILLPADWSQHARSAMLHVISLAQFALSYTRGWAVNSQVARVRLKAENDRLRQQAAWLTEEIRIKDARMSLTAHAMASDRQKCFDVGCDGYAAKPIDRQTLVETIVSHVEPVTVENRKMGRIEI